MKFLQKCQKLRLLCGSDAEKYGVVDPFAREYFFLHISDSLDVALFVQYKAFYFNEKASRNESTCF
jgi:hypothetical protein